MIDQIVYHISRKAVGYGVIEDNDLPVFRYGLVSILEIVMIMSTMLFISFGMNCLIEAVVFVGMISLCRSFGGGYHANTFKSCYFISLLIFVGGLMVIKWLPVELYDVANLICAVGAAVLTVKIPLAGSKNRQLDESERYLFRRIHYVLNGAYQLFILSAICLGIRNDVFLACSLGVLASQLSRLFQNKGV